MVSFLVPWDDIDGYVDGVVRDTGRPPWQSAIRAPVGADQILAIEVACLAGNCKVTLARDPAAPSARWRTRFLSRSTTPATPPATLWSMCPRSTRIIPRTAAISPARSLRKTTRGLSQLIKDYQAGSGAPSSDAVLAEVDLLRQGAPRSIDVLLFEADVVRHRDLQTANRDRARPATALLGEDAQRLPDTCSTLSARFDLALAADSLDEACALLDQLVRLDPDSSTTHLQRAKLHHKRGELGAACGELAAATRRGAFSWRVLYHRARLFRDLGDRTATRAAIDQPLARSPGNRGGLSLRAGDEPGAVPE